jgi:ATP-dependent exoDNAse (exonuclease V) alpha subunit
LGRDRGLDGQDERALDANTVLVVDEAGMLGSRKLARLLDHAQDAGAKVVLVGDDQQLAAIEAGGGFRGLRCGLAPPR